MMTDREMLELAAKAAGIEHLSSEYCVSGPELWDIERKRWWRPLTNDGDALRLAVKLGMDIRIYGTEVRVYCCGIIASEGPPDFNSATRRAIVRAAAEIGRSMP